MAVTRSAIMPSRLAITTISSRCNWPLEIWLLNPSFEDGIRGQCKTLLRAHGVEVVASFADECPYDDCLIVDSFDAPCNEGGIKATNIWNNMINIQRRDLALPLSLSKLVPDRWPRSGDGVHDT
jgi:hypothetical protein